MLSYIPLSYEKEKRVSVKILTVFLEKGNEVEMVKLDPFRLL